MLSFESLEKKHRQFDLLFKISDDGIISYQLLNEEENIEFITFESSLLQKRIFHYAEYSKKNRKRVFFDIINWEGSTPEAVFYRKYEFYQENSVQFLKLNRQMTTVAQNLALLDNAEILNYIDDVILVSEAEPIEGLGPRVIYANKAFEEMSGYQLSELFGKTPRIFQGEKTKAEDRAAIKSALRRWESIKIEILNYTKSKKEFFVELSINPRMDEVGWYTHWVSIQRDATQRRRTQEQIENQARLALMGEIAAGVAHEINNPLAIITASTAVIKKSKDDSEKVINKINTIESATNRIAKIVKGLLKFSRPTEDVVHKAEPLNSIVAEALILTEVKAKNDGVVLSASTEGNPSIFCDSMEIEQVLINLINNAIDAAKGREDKWVKINSFEESNQIILQVIDSGPGISESLEEKLFQPFFTTKTVGEGTGLGLSISKGILDQHKAQIKINHGLANTCFEIRFPQIS